VTRQSTHPANPFPANGIPGNSHHRVPPIQHQGKYASESLFGKHTLRPAAYPEPALPTNRFALHVQTQTPLAGNRRRQSGISVRSARRIERDAALPSQKPRRYWRSRPDPPVGPQKIELVVRRLVARGSACRCDHEPGPLGATQRPRSVRLPEGRFHTVTHSSSR
jgi:hypothetical protein